MNENEILDVEVEEEVLETLVEEETISDEEVDALVITMKEKYQENNASNEEIEAIAKTIAKNSKEYLDSETYAWVMYIYACKYAREKNGNAQRFCFMRLKQMLDIENKKASVPEALTFTTFGIPASAKQQIEGETAFVKEHIVSIGKSFMMMLMVVVVIFFLVMYFFLKMDLWLTVMFSAGLVLINYFTTYRGLGKKFIYRQTLASRNHCEEEELIAFDLPVLMS